MFKGDAKRNDFNGFLDSGSHFEGELRFENSFRIDGKFRGQVVSEGDLMIGEGGEIDGDLKVGRAFVSGTIRGTIQAKRRIHIAPGGKVYAELSTPSLVIEDGALFEGQCAMVRESEAATGSTGAVAKLVAQKASKG